MDFSSPSPSVYITVFIRNKAPTIVAVVLYVFIFSSLVIVSLLSDYAEVGDIYATRSCTRSIVAARY